MVVSQSLNQQQHLRPQVTKTKLISAAHQLNVTADPTLGDYQEEVRTDGYFVEGSVDLRDQLHFTAGVRYGGSNTFGDET